MGILDDAIREHLELKRQHGAGDPELKQLEDEVFGPPDRPGDEEAAHDPLAEAPTEFMAAPEAAEEQPAVEHEVVSEPPQPAGGHSTEERHAIAEQPTEMFDVEEEIAASDSSGPSDEELVEEEIVEPRLAPVDPLAGLEEAEAEAEIEVSGPEEEDAEEDEDDDFFDEQRLSDELDQALEAPVEEEEPEAEVEIEELDEADEEEVVEDLAVEDEDEGEPAPEPGDASSRDREDDVLEDTPDFLEDSEDDELWFEQKPPKDFDFDD
jgi:hypothetical protein